MIPAFFVQFIEVQYGCVVICYWKNPACDQPRGPFLFESSLRAEIFDALGGLRAAAGRDRRTGGDQTHGLRWLHKGRKRLHKRRIAGRVVRIAQQTREHLCNMPWNYAQKSSFAHR